jgi:hypothetical protein
VKLTRWELAALILAGWALGMATFAGLAYFAGQF